MLGLNRLSISNLYRQIAVAKCGQVLVKSRTVWEPTVGCHRMPDGVGKSQEKIWVLRLVPLVAAEVDNVKSCAR